jgi:hypothetical protein
MQSPPAELVKKCQSKVLFKETTGSPLINLNGTEEFADITTSDDMNHTT